MRSVNDITPVLLLYVISPLALINPRTSVSVRSVKLNTPVALLYDKSPVTLKSGNVIKLVSLVKSLKLLGVV